MDSNKNLWAPWREQYILGLAEEDQSDQKPGCFLCHIRDNPQDDDQNLVMYRSKLTMILLNRYPYTGGHLMVAPMEHCADLVDLPRETRIELMDMVTMAEKALHNAFNPQGINIGINVGRAAGAGLPGHLHIHVVPRWSGDTNFMDVIGKSRVIPLSNETIHREIKQAIEMVIKQNKDHD